MSEIYTIGYTGSTTAGFMASLRTHGVSMVIDVREIPISRKKGFSKSGLKSALGKAGISYEHFKPLGSPKKDRHAVREDGDYPKFFNRVRQHLRAAVPKLKMAEVLELSENHKVCLMCCCEDWTRCHRKCIVEYLARTKSVRFQHLAPTKA